MLVNKDTMASDCLAAVLSTNQMQGLKILDN